MSDGGRDITDARKTLVYQVKWTSKVEQDPVAWLKKAIQGERKNIERLVREEGATEYRIMTSVAGTSKPKTGTMDRLDEELNALSTEYGIHMQCVWQSDIDSLVDRAPDAIKWSYANMLVGHDLIRYLIYGAQIEGRAAEMRETLLKVMSTQWGEDAKVKFSQVDMDHLNLVDLFVDVEETLERSPNNALDTFIGGQQAREEGAVRYLLRTTMPLTLVRGEPGQGKSTLGQYLCQVHRSAILPSSDITMGKAPEEQVDEPKLPLRADLKDYATWLQGHDPWGEEQPKAKRPRAAERSVEHFLAALCAFHSGGRSVSVEQVQDLTQRYPVLVLLDGLDEVADTTLRTEVVKEIDRFARRMGGTAQRKFQIVVTTRPNNGGLAEPSSDMFETVKLVRLNPDLQRQYLRKWTSVHQIRAAKQRKLMNVFRARSAHDHVAQLAENPMQLTILLFLVNRRGEAVPEARTPLYTQFLDTLLDREVEKVQVVKDNLPSIHQLTSYLGWHMHAGVEAGTVPDRLETKRIKRELRNYLDEVDGPLDIVDQVFSAISDRFWALSSKVEGTFEFSVHSVREYFAARFLAEYAGLFGSEPVLKSDVLQALVERSYWANTARFFAGFANPNELLTLTGGLQDAIEGGRHPAQARHAALTLLADGVFTPVPRAQKNTALLLTDPLSVRLFAPVSSTLSIGGFYPERGSGELAAELLAACESGPHEPISRDRVRVVRRLGVARDEFEAWWRPLLEASLGSAQETDWLELGVAFGGLRLDDPTSTRLALDSPAARRAALRLNSLPESGSSAEAVMIRSVLDGECSDLLVPNVSIAGDLLTVLHPRRFFGLARPGEDRTYAISFEAPIGRQRGGDRSAAFRRLKEVDPRLARVMQAGAFRRSEGGTTAPWQHTAREVTAIHGPCLLAAEIAVIGAAVRGLDTGGSITPDAPAFGTTADYGMLVRETRAYKSSPEWWEDQLALCEDDLSRATWVMACLAVAEPSVVETHIAPLDHVLSLLGHGTFHAVAQTSGRLGASALARRIPHSIWTVAASVSPRASLMVAHHAADLKSLDSLPALAVRQLGELSAYDIASWPALRAITARLLAHDAEEMALLEALRTCGPDQFVEIPSNAPPASPVVCEEILGRPDEYPHPWVAAAERWHSARNMEPALAAVAIKRGWVPNL